MAPNIPTAPRQVRVTGLSILAPGLDQRVPSEMQQSVKENGISVLPYLQELNIYESIFDNTICGNITLLEDVGLIELVPIMGVEYLWVAFEIDKPTGEVAKYTRMFRIVKVMDISYPRHDHRLFTMELSTHEFVTSVSHRVSRCYKQKQVREIVEDILKKDLDVAGDRLIKVEETFGKIDIVIPNFNPLQAINYLTLLGKTKDGLESNFVFYETLNGFCFTSIAKLIEDGMKEATKADAPVYRVNPGGTTGGMVVADQTVRDSFMRLHQEHSFDLLKDIVGGMVRSQMVHFDFLARKLEYIDNSKYSDTFKKTKHLDKGMLYPENYDQGVGKNVRTFTFPSNVWTANGAWQKENDPEAAEQALYANIILHNRQLREIQHVSTLVEMPGHPDIRTGSVINVAYPSTRAMVGIEGSKNQSVQEVDTPLFTGPHLVTSVRHMFVPHGPNSMSYIMHLNLNRDAYHIKTGKFQQGEAYD